MVEVRADQGGLYALAGSPPEVRVDLSGLYALADIAPITTVDQAGLLVLVAITPVVRVDQLGMYVLAGGSPCVTHWAQAWTIRRSDGEVFRFTSLDRDLSWRGETFASCDSLVPSASEAVSEVDAAGNMDLSGAVGPDGISEHDLHAGLFDGAEVEAWLVAWRGEEPRKLLLRGTFGPVEVSSTGFKAELLGDGAKLMQTPLVRLIQPGCRWQFGDPVTCKKDLAPLTVTGTVDAATGQRGFVDAARGEAAGYFSRGRVTFTSGDNAGISAEIKEHGAGGTFTLWPKVAFPISAGDGYAMTPGCTNLKDASGGTNGCEAWGQLPRYGGFDKVPGGDKRGAAANVR